MLTNRSRIFLRKLKAQEGLQVPYLDQADQYKDYYSMNAPANIEENLAPNFEVAKDRATKGIFNFQPGAIQLPDDIGFGSFTNAQGETQQRKGSYEISEKIGKMNIPFLSNWTKSVVGAYDFLESFKDKKKQKAYEKNSMADLKRRKEEARANSFYLTPYSTGRTDKLQKGGAIGNSNVMDSFMDYYNAQQDKSLESIQQLQQGYEQRNKQLETEWKNRQVQGFAQWQGAGAASFGEYMKTFGGGMGGGMGAMQQGGLISNDKIQQLLKLDSNITPESTLTSFPLKSYNPVSYTESVALQNKAQISMDEDNFISGNMTQKEFLNKRGQTIYSESNKIKSKGRYREKQEGGEIDMTSNRDTESLYSPDFVSPWQQPDIDIEQSQDLQNRVYADNPGLSYENKDSLMGWLFEDEPIQTYTISDIYDTTFSVGSGNNDEDQNGNGNENNQLPIQPIIENFSKLGIGVGSINTGKHNPGSKHYEGKAFDIPASRNGGREGLYKIYNYLNSPEGKRQFPNIRVINEIDKPAGKVGDANHIHIELA